MRKIILLAAITIIAMLPQISFAAVIYDNGGPDLYNAYYSDPSYSLLRAADNFILESGESVVTDIHWWGEYKNASSMLDDFTITIYNTAAGASLPGASVYTNNIGDVAGIKTGLVGMDGLDIYYYFITVDQISLSANTTYWLEILNNTQGESWAWSTSNYTGLHSAWFPGYGWDRIGDELAFNLTNDNNNPPVPEPATMLLLGSGLVGLAGFRKKMKK